MRVSIDYSKCQGHAVCNLRVPQVFHLNDTDGRALIPDADVPIELEEQVQRAADNCPESAIIIER